MTKKFINMVSSKQIEEHIDVPFTLVGTKHWIETNVSEEAREQISIVYDTEIEDVIACLSMRPVLGLDTETGGDNKRDGLDPISPTSKLILFQIGTPNMVYLFEPNLLPKLTSILQDPKILKIGQNIIHDHKFVLNKYGITLCKHHFDKKLDKCIPEVYDTMLAEQLLTAGLFGASVGLEELAEKYPPHYLISKEVRKEFITFTGLLEYKHLYYAARDVYLLFPIRKRQLELIATHKGMPNSNYTLADRVDLEMCAIYGTADAELTGFDISEEVIRENINYYRRKADRIRKEVTKLYNDILEKKGMKRTFVLPDSMEEFDLNSNKAKLTALFRIGIEVEDVQRETLFKIGEKITDLLGEYTECSKVISTYGEGLLNRRSVFDGRVHPEFHQLGLGDLESKKSKGKAKTIATGRWASDAQQFPRAEHILEPVGPEKEKELTEVFKDKINDNKKLV